MRKIILMLALVTAGELVFGLPFNIPRFLKPTMLEAFGLTNTQFGDLFAIYGIAAMLSYFPGGTLADHFSARSLMSMSLLATALGGLFMTTIPDHTGLAYLYGYWGLTTIFLFWGAMIRATREWGDAQTQGVAFGLLEGGRGAVAALMATIAVSVLAFYMPDNANLATPGEREAGLRSVIYFYTAVTVLAAVFVWFAVPVVKIKSGVSFNPLREMLAVFRRPIVWAHAAIIICAYCGYKNLDNYALYAVQVLGMDEVEGSRLASYSVWIRPVAAILTGVAADRFGVARSIAVTFFVLGASYFCWSLLVPADHGVAIIYANFMVTQIAIYALRGIYFALLEEVDTPRALTGAAVGMVSFVGYAPEIFFAPISGRILDADPGLVGFQNVFMLLGGFSLLGFVAVIYLLRLCRRGPKAVWGTLLT